MIIDRMMLKDVERVYDISKNSFSKPWSLNAIQEELYNTMSYYLVARDDFGKAIAFIGSWLVFDECQITNIAVDEDYRRKNVGQRLLERFIGDMKSKDMSYIFLEVRESNEPAKKFYEKNSFTYTGMRKRFYQDGENALLMTLYLKKQGS